MERDLEEADAVDPFEGYSPHHTKKEEWTEGDYNKLADLKARRFLNTASDLKPWWRRMPMSDFKAVYDATAAKRMAAGKSAPGSCSLMVRGSFAPSSVFDRACPTTHLQHLMIPGSLSRARPYSTSR